MRPRNQLSSSHPHALGQRYQQIRVRSHDWTQGPSGRDALRVLTAQSPVSAQQGAVSRRERVEAVLWMADQPLPSRRLAQLANLDDGTEARRLVGELRQLHRQRQSAFEIVEVAGGFQLLTRPGLAPWLVEKGPNKQTPAAQPQIESLSSAALETLAIVALRQPALRAEVEAIRGVACGELLRQLLEVDLLRIVGRSEELGRPLLYGTTRSFLQLFGLRNLDGLHQLAACSQVMGPTKNNDQPTTALNASQEGKTVAQDQADANQPAA